VKLNDRRYPNPNEVEVTGSNPVQGSLYSYYYDVYNNNNQAELPRQLDEQQSITTTMIIDWSVFKDYLEKTYNHNTAKVRMCYARQFYSVLLNGDAKKLLSIESEQKRLNVMKSLTVLSKYLGCYDRWNEQRKRYNLKWTTGNESLHAMQRFFDTNLTLDSMIAKVKQMIHLLLPPMGKIIRFALITGLRPSEVVESVRLLNGGGRGKGVSIDRPYYNPERQALEHFRFPDVFLRTTKKGVHILYHS
jgi:hypothetical protein